MEDGREAVFGADKSFERVSQANTSHGSSRQVPQFARASSRQQLTGPSMMNRATSTASRASLLQSKSFLTRTGSVQRDPNESTDIKQQRGGLARHLTKPTYERPDVKKDEEAKSSNPAEWGVHAGVCSKCRVTVDSALWEDSSVCNYASAARAEARAAVARQKQAEGRAETSLGMSATKRNVVERHEFDKWQAKISSTTSTTGPREKSVSGDCCICMYLIHRSIANGDTPGVVNRPHGASSTTPREEGPISRNTSRVPSRQVSRVPSRQVSRHVSRQASPRGSGESLDGKRLGVGAKAGGRRRMVADSASGRTPNFSLEETGGLESLGRDVALCKPCCARINAMNDVAESMRSEGEITDTERKLLESIGEGTDEKDFDEACSSLGKIYDGYMNCGAACKAILDKEMGVGAFIKRCKAALVSSDRGVEWFAANFIKSLDDTKGLLDVSRCDLREVRDLSLLGDKLRSLDVSHNRLLTKLPVSTLAAMPSLQALECGGCRKLISPPQEIARQGSREVMDFLRSIHVDGSVNTEVLLFTIGDGESGKTSTVRALMSPSNDCEAISADNRTVGVDITPWTPEKEMGGDGELEYLIHDMAGQAVYAVTHQYFLAERAVYMLVWRARDVDLEAGGVDEALAGVRGMIENWTDMIANRVPGVPVVFVVTHIDCVAPEILDMQTEWVRSVSKEVPDKVTIHNEGQSYRVNCRSGEGIKDLRASLMKLTMASRSYKEALPGTWIKIRAALLDLQQSGRVWLSVDEYRNIARQSGLEGVMLVVATRFLHETGSIRYFGDYASLPVIGTRTGYPEEEYGYGEAPDEGEQQLSGLEQTVFISAPWMVNVLKGLVRHERDSLLEFFGTKNRGMARRVQRLIVHGALHESLAPYLWPSSGDAQEYWKSVREGTGPLNEREKSMWDGQDVVKNPDDVNRALSLLSGFNMIAESTNSEYAVPTLISRERNNGIDRRGFSSVDCPFYSSYDFASLPPGFIEGIAVRLWRQASHAEYSPTCAAFYRRGTMAQMFVTDRSTGMGRRRILLTVRASTRKFWRLLKSEVEKMATFFPGMPPVRPEDREPDKDTKEPVEVLILSSKGQITAGSTVIPKGPPTVEVSAEQFMDVPNLLYLHLDNLLPELSAQLAGSVDARKPSELPKERRAPPPRGTVEKVMDSLSSVLCSKNTVKGDEAEQDPFWWMVPGKDGPPTLVESLVQPKGGLDATFECECATVRVQDELIAILVGATVAEIVRDVVPWLRTGVKSVRKLVKGKDSAVGVEIMADLVAEIGAEFLQETLSSALEEEIDGNEAKVLSVIQGTGGMIEADDGTVIVNAKLGYQGVIVASYPRPLVVAKPDTSDAMVALDRPIDEATWPCETVGKMLMRQGEHISVQMTSADRAFDGQARVILLLMDEYIWRSTICIEKYRNLEKGDAGGALIPLILPGFEIQDYSKWWPSTMPELSKHALFVDMRNPDTWQLKVESELMPQVIKFLEEWRGTPERFEEAAEFDDVSPDGRAPTESSADDDVVECTRCFISGMEHPHRFSRKHLKVVNEEWLARKLKSFEHETPEATPAASPSGTPVAGAFRGNSFRGLTPTGSFKASTHKNSSSPEKKGSMSILEQVLEQRISALSTSNQGGRSPMGAVRTPMGATAPRTPMGAARSRPGSAASSRPRSASGANTGGHVVCKYGHKVQVMELLSLSFVKESIACPGCSSAGDLPPFSFERKELLLYFSESNTNKIGTVKCPRCRTAGRTWHHRIMDIMAPEVFLSYNWGRRVTPERGPSYFATQRLVTALQRKIEQEADITCWLDVAGGMGAGQDLNKEMLEGVGKAGVFVLFLSDAYCVSRNCRAEISNAMKFGKYIVPVLLPGVKAEGPQGYSDGWTGPGYEDSHWWQHARRIAKVAEKEIKQENGDELAVVAWSALSQFAPIDLRGEELEEGALKVDSKGLVTILNRVLSRLHRGEYVQYRTKAGYQSWRRATHKLAVRMKEMQLEGEDARGDWEGVLEAKLRKLFDMFDADGSGGIDLDELHAALKGLGVIVSEDEAAVMMHQADTDGNGTIEFEEFYSIFDGILGEENAIIDMGEAPPLGDGTAELAEAAKGDGRIPLKSGKSHPHLHTMLTDQVLQLPLLSSAADLAGAD